VLQHCSCSRHCPSLKCSLHEVHVVLFRHGITTTLSSKRLRRGLETGMATLRNMLYVLAGNRTIGRNPNSAKTVLRQPCRADNQMHRFTGPTGKKPEANTNTDSPKLWVQLLKGCCTRSPLCFVILLQTSPQRRVEKESVKTAESNNRAAASMRH